MFKKGVINFILVFAMMVPGILLTQKAHMPLSSSELSIWVIVGYLVGLMNLTAHLIMMKKILLPLKSMSPSKQTALIRTMLSVISIFEAKIS